MFTILTITLPRCLPLFPLQLEGTIPSALTGLTRLTTLDVSSNWLTGPVPASLNANAMPTLQQVSFEGNTITGVVGVPPASLVTPAPCAAALVSSIDSGITEA